MAASSDDLHRVFRPFWTRRVTLVFAALQGTVFVAVALLLPGEGVGAFRWYDRLGIILVSAGIATMLWRFSGSVATPDPQGLTVRNLARSRYLDWAQIVNVRFGGGAPWVLLDLSDGDQVPVMAIQRSDGERGVTESRRLATLVALHGTSPRGD